ncbi:MAG: aminotransferase class IV [Thermodesulfobacteriota bacterium]
MDTYYIDGKYVDEDKAMVSVKDITVLRGYGVFDFMITYNKRPFRLEQHVTRFENSAARIGLQLNHTHQEICDIVVEAIRRNPHHNESNIRILYTGGISPDSVTPQGNGILMVMVTPRHELPDWWYTDGAAIALVDMERFIPTSKSTAYLNAVYAQQQARKTGAIEAVYVDRDHRVLEGTTTNIYGIKGNELITPPDGILPGVTRGVVLELAEALLDVNLRHIDRKELAQMDEIFISASNKEIVPVIRVDDMTVGDGKPGKVTREIMKRFRELTIAFGQGKAK